MRPLSKVLFLSPLLHFSDFDSELSSDPCRSNYIVLPEGSTFLSVEHYGTSAYAITGRLVAQNPDETETVYFIKVSLPVSLRSTNENLNEVT